MTDPGYVIEDTAEGRSLVVTGAWSAAAVDALERHDADGLVLNYARGFVGERRPAISPAPSSAQAGPGVEGRFGSRAGRHEGPSAS